MIDSVFIADENYYPQLCLEKCKHIVQEKKMPRYITDNIDTSSDKENFDEETSVEENCGEENSNEKKSDEENSLIKSLLREQFLTMPFWGSNFDKYLSCLLMGMDDDWDGRFSVFLLIGL